ncbi:MAG: aminotransferase class V-fold PLP-dependent enzyme [Ruminococcaceae bacterium]|nr:aminotransferase class V-fold PLP-dependent enzyme [Oscillospiraceae bacterium]
MIYFDNAATTGKKPKTVVDAVNFALNNLSANPGRSGHDLSIKTADEVYNVRAKTAEFFGAEGAENVIFTLNCTHSINCVLKGVVKMGDHVVVSNLEHNAVMRPLAKMKIPYTAVEVKDDVGETLDRFKRAIKPNTRLVLVSGASNVTGQILPIEEIGEICHKRGVVFCVDAAQIAGVLTINMKKMNIDFLCVAPHKGLYAPMGIGLLICRKNLENTIIEGGTGTDSLDYSQPRFLPERLESGTIGVPLIMGVGAGVDFVKKTGVEKIYRHELMLCQKLYDVISSDKDIILYTKRPEFGFYAPVLPFNFKGCESYHFAKMLNSHNFAVRAGFHCAPTAHKVMKTLNSGAVRVSFGAFNTEAEIKSLISLLKDKNFKEKLKKSIE